MKLAVAWSALLLAGLLPAAVSDARSRTIPDRANLPILAAGTLRLAFFSGSAERLASLILTACLVLLFVFITLRDYDAMGGGDMKILLSLSLALGAAGSCLMLLVSCSAALLFGWLFRRKRVAMAPFFLLGSAVSAALFFPV
jgi:Flp pilus assembly protein protease CpaA